MRTTKSIRPLDSQFLTYSYRRICALLRKREKLIVNRRKVYRLMSAQRKLVTQRYVSPKPRVQQSCSRMERSSERLGNGHLTRVLWGRWLGTPGDRD